MRRDGFLASLNEAARRLGGEAHGNYVSCPGPGHSALDRSLSVRFGPDGSFTVYSFSNDDWRICRDHVRVALGLPQFDGRGERRVAAIDPSPPVNERLEQIARNQRVARLWRDSLDPRGTLVEIYLAGRGLFLPDNMAGRVIRFHPACPWRERDGEPTIRVPAMISRYSPILFDYDAEGMPTALHRTRLAEDGSGHRGKKMLGSPIGQVVKLSADEDVAEGLMLAEGIETSLALLNHGFRPLWAATTAGIMKTFPLMGGVEALTLFADNDPHSVGFEAANAAAKRWHQAGREIRIIVPQQLGGDFADYYLEHP